MKKGWKRHFIRLATCVVSQDNAAGRRATSVCLSYYKNKRIDDSGNQLVDSIPLIRAKVTEHQVTPESVVEVATEVRNPIQSVSRGSVMNLNSRASVVRGRGSMMNTTNAGPTGESGDSEAAVNSADSKPSFSGSCFGGAGKQLSFLKIEAQDGRELHLRPERAADLQRWIELLDQAIKQADQYADDQEGAKKHADKDDDGFESLKFHGPLQVWSKSLNAASWIAYWFELDEWDCMTYYDSSKDAELHANDAELDAKVKGTVLLKDGTLYNVQRDEKHKRTEPNCVFEFRTQLGVRLILKAPFFLLN